MIYLSLIYAGNFLLFHSVHAQHLRPSHRIPTYLALPHSETLSAVLLDAISSIECADAPPETFTFGAPYEWRGEMVYRTCEWITENPDPEIMLKRQKNWCNDSISTSTKVKDMCPVTCGLCAPSTSPSISPSLTPSASPSQELFNLSQCETYMETW